ncbi:hypothetical protein [Tateyamaria sp. syn59]|uniref:hypothetical protein n=1 Tax=Tateyamaria sp. syn59 TaxID=2576942 RepID=UPI0011BEDE34|nr:hypothetical protein [Tateyamaria sp. syn59]
MGFLSHGKSVAAISCALAMASSASEASIPIECAAGETSYSLVHDLNAHLSVFLLADEQRLLLANCSGREMIAVEQLGEPSLSHHIGHALGEIERMSASSTFFTFDDVVARLRNQEFTADIVPLRRDECVCGEN